jgi:hypothetical protein
MGGRQEQMGEKEKVENKVEREEEEEEEEEEGSLLCYA